MEHFSYKGECGVRECTCIEVFKRRAGLSYPIWKQVDILISKNQALQILYLKHCVYKTTLLELPWIRNLRNARKFMINNHSIQCYTNNKITYLVTGQLQQEIIINMSLYICII